MQASGAGSTMLDREHARPLVLPADEDARRKVVVQRHAAERVHVDVPTAVAWEGHRLAREQRVEAQLVGYAAVRASLGSSG